MDKNIIENARKYIKDLFQNDSGGHDYYHSIRVYNLATHIAQFENADIMLTQLIALLHDVDDYKLFPGNTNFQNTRYFLNIQKFQPLQIDAICSVIAEISYKGSKSYAPKSIEGKIVQDADRLDAIGAIGIARTFAYGGTVNRPIHDPSIAPNPDMNYSFYQNYKGTSINHFYEKLLCLKDSFNTSEAKKIAEQRHSFMKNFLDEFLNEWECKF